MSTYQFVIDQIPDAELDRFLDWMEQFRVETGCQFRYRQSAGARNALVVVPRHEEAVE